MNNSSYDSPYVIIITWVTAILTLVESSHNKTLDENDSHAEKTARVHAACCVKSPLCYINGLNKTTHSKAN